MEFNFDKWQDELTDVIAATLTEFGTDDYDEMELFAVDCHPWNGVIALGFLTQSELIRAPYLLETAEMAAWKYYDFGAGLASWQRVSNLASAMRRNYESSDDNREDIARRFFQRCAAGVASKPVQDALLAFPLAKKFRISIQHPDTGEEFYS